MNDDGYLWGPGEREHSRPVPNHIYIPTWEFCGTAGRGRICFLLELFRKQDSMWSCWQPSCHPEVEILGKEPTQRKRGLEKIMLSPDAIIWVSGSSHAWHEIYPWSSQLCSYKLSLFVFAQNDINCKLSLASYTTNKWVTQNTNAVISEKKQKLFLEKLGYLLEVHGIDDNSLRIRRCLG